MSAATSPLTVNPTPTTAQQQAAQRDNADFDKDTMDSSRPAPPPAYSAVSRVTRGRSLRPIVLLCTAGSFIWSICISAAYFRRTFADGNSGKLLASYIIQGVFFAVLALLEVVGFWAAWKQQIKAGKLYTWLVILGAVLVVVAETIRLALHFVFKQDILNACAVQERNDLDTYTSASDAEITDWCYSAWRNNVYKDIAWIVFGIVCSYFMYVLARAYVHQLSDPAFGRVQANSDRYRMNEIEAQNVPYGQDPPFVPPYGGPAGASAGYAPPPVYDAPAYTPPEKGFAFSDGKKQGDVGTADAHDRDIAGQTEHNQNPFGRSESETTLPGREREGRL